MAKNIFEHIKSEHREVESLLEQLSSSYDRSTYDLLNQSLQAHMRAEEESLYPAMDEQESMMVQHSREGHDQVRELLVQLKERGGAPDSLSRLSKVIRDHIGEEESAMFPRAREMFDRSRIDQLSQRFDEVDDQVIQQIR